MINPYDYVEIDPEEQPEVAAGGSQEPRSIAAPTTGGSESPGNAQEAPDGDFCMTTPDLEPWRREDAQSGDDPLDAQVEGYGRGGPGDDELCCATCGRPFALHGINCPTLLEAAEPDICTAARGSHPRLFGNELTEIAAAIDQDAAQMQDALDAAQDVRADSSFQVEVAIALWLPHQAARIEIVDAVERLRNARCKVEEAVKELKYTVVDTLSSHEEGEAIEVEVLDAEPFLSRLGAIYGERAKGEAHKERQERDVFVAELVEVLGLDREAIDRSGEPVGNAILEAVSAAVITAEEGQEIIGELKAAIAVLLGEDLTPCQHPCAGHLGPRAHAVVDEAVSRWRTLAEGSRQPVAADLRPLLERCRGRVLCALERGERHYDDDLLLADLRAALAEGVAR